MGKVSLKDRDSRSSKQKRRLRSSSSSRYLKPGYFRTSAGKSGTDFGKKRVAVFGKNNKKKEEEEEEEEEDGYVAVESQVFDKSPLMVSLSPVVDLVEQNHLVRTPKTPRLEDFDYESRLESLPMDLLVKILCHLHHDQLRAVFHVSQRIRRAVLIARQFYFNFTTPDRSRQEMLRIMTPRPTEYWPFVSKADGKGSFMASPHTPKAPKHGPRPPSRIRITDVKQIAAVLFQDSAFPSRCMVPSAISKPLCKSLASNRVLFYEDELCQAVAQNKLR